MKRELTEGNVQKTLLLFAGPMILGNLLQQCYNIADTLIVGRFIGAEALAAVGSTYTLMTFLTSVLIGLCMGSGSVWSFYYGKQEQEKLRNSILASFFLIAGFSVLVNVVVFVELEQILRLLQTPEALFRMTREYVVVIFVGIFFVFLYNYFAFLLRALGDSVTPLWFLGIASVLNILLDLLFVISFHWGIKGAALATVLAQAVSGVGIGIYTWIKWKKRIFPDQTLSAFRKERGIWSGIREVMVEVLRFSLAASVQQSVMNFGILLIQGLINSFGTVIMAAYAAAVKIDSLAYMPAQEFSNAFSIFVSQNTGAGEKRRVRQSVRSAFRISIIFCLLVSVFIFLTAPYLMTIFIHASETEIITEGVKYLRIEGACYCGIGILFLLYAYYRGIGKPEMSVVLTIISLGTRVLLSYTLAPTVGVTAIWIAIPVGWLLADVTGVVCMFVRNR